MKKIIFEKLTVRETAYIRGASLNDRGILVTSTTVTAKECTSDDTPTAGGCDIQDDVITCGNPSLPEIPCVGASNPEPEPGCRP